jgi:hypothetical protein
MVMITVRGKHERSGHQQPLGYISIVCPLYLLVYLPSSHSDASAYRQQGAELFTGNTALVGAALMEGKVSIYMHDSNLESNNELEVQVDYELGVSGYTFVPWVLISSVFRHLLCHSSCSHTRLALGFVVILALMVIVALSCRQVTMGQLMKSWIASYAGNLVGRSLNHRSPLPFSLCLPR